MKRFPFFPIIAVILAIGCGDKDVMGPGTGSVALNQTGGEDVDPPTLTAFDFTPKTVNTTEGPATVTVDYTVTDDLSGAVSFWVSFRSPSGAQSRGMGASYGPAGSHTGSATVTFLQYGEAGTWTVDYVTLRDAVANFSYLNTADLAALGFPTELEVESVQDVDPPTLTAFDFTPKTINTTGGEASVTVDFTVTDDLSGARSFWVSFRSPSGAQSRGMGASFGPAGSHTGSATVTFLQSGEAGTWTVDYVTLRDAVANFSYLNTADLAALGFPTELEVAVNEPPVADANGPYSGVEGSAVLLDGSGSTDPNDAIVAYEWDLDNDGDYDDASGVTATTTYADNGWYTVGLRVTDSFGESDTDEAEVTVSNAPPLVDAGPDAVVYSGEWFSQSGSFTDPGTDDTHTATVDHGDGSQPLALVDHGFTLNHQYFAPATHAVWVTVTDNDGGAGSDGVNVTVTPVPASVDIKPGSYPNCIKQTSNGRIPVAILAQVDFDPGDVDPVTALLEGVSPLRWSLNKDVSNDGIPDLVLQYRTQELNARGVLLDGNALVLTGRLFDGRHFQGSDDVYLAGGPNCFDQP